nr:MFS transporter [Aliamphritea spongicola]
MRVVWLGGAQMSAWGCLLYSFPMLAEALLAEYGWSRFEVYAAGSVAMAVAAISAYPVGRWIDLGYGRAVMCLGGLLGAGVLGGLSQVDAIWQLYVLYVLMGMALAASLYEPLFACVTFCFGVEQARYIIPRLTLWAGFASLVFMPYTQLLIDTFGWRLAMSVLGLTYVLIAPGIYFWLLKPPEKLPRVRGPVTHKESGVLRLSVFWYLVVAFVGYGLIQAGLNFHLFAILLEKQLGVATAIWLVAMLGPVQVAGRIWLMLLLRSRAATGAAVMLTLFQPLVLLAMYLSSAVVPLWVVIIVFYGLLGGSLIIVKGIVIIDYFPDQPYGRVNALLTAPYNLAQAVAPLVGAALWLLGSSYDSYLWLLFGVSLLIPLSFYLVRRRHERDNPEPEQAV